MVENQKISQLTLAQESQLAIYRQKWQNLAFPGNSSPEAAMQSAIGRAYELLNLPIPRIYVFESLFNIPNAFWSSPSWQNSGSPVFLPKKPDAALNRNSY